MTTATRLPRSAAVAIRAERDAADRARRSAYDRLRHAPRLAPADPFALTPEEIELRAAAIRRRWTAARWAHERGDRWDRMALLFHAIGGGL
jgi:hypothetical protein